MIVVDASLAAAWLLHETEAVPAQSLLDVLARNTILVPAHWATEVGNAVRRAVRTGRLEQREVPLLFERLNLLEIEIAPPVGVAGLAALVDYALEQGLSVYDAAYLQLARERRLSLATLDRSVRLAAVRSNVGLLPP